jgi:hypothetical protein
VENYAAKPWAGVAGFERILNQAGYRLTKDDDGHWVARRDLTPDRASD